MVQPIRTGIDLNAAFSASGVLSPGAPQVPDPENPVRSFDFPLAVNTTPSVRTLPESFTPRQLRELARAELVRLAIETRKDQMERLDWRIRPMGRSATPQDAPLIQAATRFFRKPDGVTPFGAWLRLSLEDLLVLDAPAFEKRRDRAGRLIGLDVIDGATIKVLIDETGRSPLPPLPAYQQVIKGRVWANLSRDDLLYAPRNLRPGHIYGLSPTEQVAATIQISLNRQRAQAAYFTDSNVPSGLITVPPEWTPDQIRQYADAFNAQLQGNLEERAKIIFAPSGAAYHAFKDSPLKDNFDEWLARIVCFAFCLPPSGLVQAVNRAVADNDQDRNEGEGIDPLKGWWKTLADQILAEELGLTGFEWAWAPATEIDAQKQAMIDQIYLTTQVKTINEVRAELGLPARPGGDQPPPPAPPHPAASPPPSPARGEG